ncbi:MAG: heme-copper oxidase subunit III [Pseudanabaenaceae cyanobacterium SKYGB_i_bin29]|nr:heme-copper oxidase subunit III [Pseudanabaenaceae cyanobacterium SKYG29]MDW8420977.1 heme-copper oxidase subunit III [Pseudanabaenaceae cyanobacterium SKYGB_i_bin29]
MQGIAPESISHDLAAQAVDHHHDHPDLRVFGLLLFLVSEGMIFMGLFSAYLLYRSGYEVWPPADTEVEILIPAINTAILVSSSFVIHQADEAIKHYKLGAVRGWLFTTFVMGVIFLAGQVYEYRHLEFTLSTNLFGSAFYVLTGFHGFHVCIGLLIILGVLLNSFRRDAFRDKHFGIIGASIYWHFVDVIWIILFGLLYIL